eukprot:3164368-Pyramimonas_sp.AAC.1
MQQQARQGTGETRRAQEHGAVGKWEGTDGSLTHSDSRDALGQANDQNPVKEQSTVSSEPTDSQGYAA